MSEFTSDIKIHDILYRITEKRHTYISDFIFLIEKIEVYLCEIRAESPFYTNMFSRIRKCSRKNHIKQKHAIFPMWVQYEIFILKWSSETTVCHEKCSAIVRIPWSIEELSLKCVGAIFFGQDDKVLSHISSRRKSYLFLAISMLVREDIILRSVWPSEFFHRKRMRSEWIASIFVLFRDEKEWILLEEGEHSRYILDLIRHEEITRWHLKGLSGIFFCLLHHVIEVALYRRIVREEIPIDAYELYVWVISYVGKFLLKTDGPWHSERPRLTLER